MTDSGNRELVPVDQLVTGVYVAELDRPWIETPFLFQGFRIDSDAELETLRAHCAHVYVDTDRSDRDALSRMRAGVAARPGRSSVESTGTAGGGRAGSRNITSSDATRAFGNARHPDAVQFGKALEAAHEVRSDARRVVDAAMRDVRLGKSVDATQARDLIQDLVTTVSGSASAALWLTNLKDRDEYTSIHCVNVCVLALAFGLYLGLDRNELVRLGLGALLHDVGKTRTPPDVLNKQGPLTSAEFEIIKRHAEDGYQIMAATGGLGEPSLAVIRHHHERRGGHGYPFGLEGDHVPLFARVTGLVDAYDAMTSDRVYHAGMSADRALKRLYDGGDREFGNDLAQAFIRCVGIFPVGSVVELDNGAIGVVVASRAEARLQPTVLLVRTPGGESYEKRVLLNLAGRDRRPGAAHRIRRALEPAAAGVDVPAVVAGEFGLDARV